jgi:hypothetical protein
MISNLHSIVIEIIHSWPVENRPMHLSQTILPFPSFSADKGGLFKAVNE